MWHIFGANDQNTAKEIEIDLSFLNNDSGYIILENESCFQQVPVSKKTKLKVTMKPNGGFVVKI